MSKLENANEIMFSFLKRKQCDCRSKLVLGFDSDGYDLYGFWLCICDINMEACQIGVELVSDALQTKPKTRHIEYTACSLVVRCKRIGINCVTAGVATCKRNGVNRWFVRTELPMRLSMQYIWFIQ